MWPACDAPTQRLAKPRTNTSSSNLLSLASPQSLTSPPVTPFEPSLSSEDVTVKACQTGDSRSRRQSRSKLREYLRGQSSDEEDVQKQKVVKPGAKRGVRERLSRSSSSLYHLTSGKSSTTQFPSPSSFELDDGDNSRVRQEITEKALTDSVAARNHVPEPIDEDRHPDAMKSPIRRRSLYTPGLATRSPDDLLRKPPQPGQESGQSGAYRHDTQVPSSSPLDELVALATSRTKKLVESSGRSTPTHFDQLGALGLGTLRITNDTEPPEPPGYARSHAHQLTSRHPGLEDNEYFTASEGNKSEDDASVSNMVNLPADRTSEPRGRLSPLKSENQWGSIASQRQPLLPSTEDLEHGPSNQIFGGIGGQREDYFSDSMALLQSPDQASVFAQAYISELSDSPYKTAHPAAGAHQNTADEANRRQWVQNPVLHGTSAQGEVTEATEIKSRRWDAWQAIHNDEAEARHANSSNTTEDAYRILSGESVPRHLSQPPQSQRIDFPTGDRGDYDRYDSLSTTLSRSPGPFSPERAIKDEPVPKSRNASHFDSGYASWVNISQSLHSEPDDDYVSYSNDRWSQHRPSISNPPEVPHQPLRGTEDYADPSANGCTIDPVQPALEVVPRPQTTITASSYPILSSQSQPVAPTTNTSPIQCQPQIVVPSPHRSPRYSTSELRRSDERLTPPPSDIFPTRVRKLQKTRRRPKSTSIDMTATQELSELTNTDIPIVPPSLASKHEERLRGFSTLEHTYPSLQNENLEDSRSSSGEVASVPIRFPSPTNSIEERGNAICNTDIAWPTRASKKKAKELKAEQAAAAKKSHRRKSESEALTRIADFGTVSNSLGSSPYDIAKALDTPKAHSSTASSANRSHPQNTSIQVPRSKSVVGMDDAAAAEASRLRFERRSSRDTVKLRTQDRKSFQNVNELPDHRSRPKSMFAGGVPHTFHVDGLRAHKVSRDGGVDSLEKSQPRNAPTDVPPVPNLPSADQTQYLEAMANRDHQSNVPMIRKARLDHRPAKLVRPKSMYASTPSVPIIAQVPPRQHLSKQSMGDSQTSSPGTLSFRFLATSTICLRQGSEHKTTRDQHGVPGVQKDHSQHSYGPLERKGSPANSPANLASTVLSQPDSAKYNEAVVVLDALPDVDRMKERGPESGKPDVRKSEALKDDSPRKDYSNKDPFLDKVKQWTEDFQKSNGPQSRESWDVSRQAWSERRQSASEALLTSSKLPGSRLSQPVAAPSVDAALRAVKANRSRSGDISSLPSAAITPREISSSPVSPVSVIHDDTLLPSGRPTSCLEPASIPKAPSSPPKDMNAIPAPVTQRRAPDPPRETDGMLIDDLQTVEKVSTRIFTKQPKYDDWEKNWYRGSTQSPPKTPRKTQRKMISLNGPSPKNKSPVISNPTAVIADSYRSHADAAPAPPAFSIHSKRVSSFNCFHPVPSARSLKPVRPVSVPAPGINSPRESSMSAPDDSRRDTPPSTSQSPAQPTPFASKNSLPTQQQQPNGSPTEQSARLPITNSPMPPKSSPSAPTSAPPVPSPITDSRFTNVSGRYQGGLEFGYERGFGIGGSCGTRASATGATRKSVAVGREFGLDFSDVPVFLRPRNGAQGR